MTDGSETKTEILRQSGCLHRRWQAVCDPAFLGQEPFFDARDLVQVKYEMLRRVRVGGQSVAETARAFGLSRMTYYQSLSAFEEHGLVGLIPQRPGPRRAHKLSAEVVAFLEEARQSDRRLRATALVELVHQRFGVSVHPRSIERALSRQQKKGRRALTASR